MRRLMLIVFLVAAAGIVVISVNGPGHDRPADASAAPSRASTTVSGPKSGTKPAARARVGATVVMRNLAFSRATVTLRRGQAVRFVNHDDVSHTVVQDIGARGGQAPLFESGRVVPGSSYRFVATAAGTFTYVCTLHPTVMRGRIVVTRGA